MKIAAIVAGVLVTGALLFAVMTRKRAKAATPKARADATDVNAQNVGHALATAAGAWVADTLDNTLRKLFGSDTQDSQTKQELQAPTTDYEPAYTDGGVWV